MTETHETRLKRIKMRAWHRGMKEMDIILGRFADDRLADLPEARLDLLEALMEENDQLLYKWVTGQTPTPPRFVPLIDEIADHAGARPA